MEPPGDRRGDRGSGDGEPSAASFSRLRFWVAAAIVAVWVVIYLRSALDASFHAPPELSAVMLGVVAWLFAGPALRGKSDD